MARARKRLPLPAEPVEVEIRALDRRGRGVGHGPDERAVRVPGTLAGERVRARYRRRGRRGDDAELAEVLVAAPERVAPGCPHFHQCGGCAWQQLAPETQLRAKEQRVLAALAEAGVTPTRVAPPIRGPAFGYRRRARLGVRFVPDKGGALVGFREKFGNRLAILESCAVLHPAVGARLGELRAIVGELDARRDIAQIEVAAGDGEVALVFRHLVPLTAEDVERLRRFADATRLTIALQPGGPDSVMGLDGGPAPELHYRLDAFDLDLHFHPLDFVQVNAAVNEALVAHAVAELEPAGRVLDLFCGLGNFTLALARAVESGAVREVLGLEGEARLVERAASNARRNGVERVSFEVADLYQPDALAPFLRDGVDRVLLDPPQSGAEPALRALCEAVRPPRIVYVSCQPDTLATDLAMLTREFGYELRTLALADMFPHTDHIETVATLDHAEAGT